MRIILFFVLALPACNIYKSQKNYIKKIKNKEEGITFYTRNSLATYYIDKDEEKAGFEYDLIQDFADKYGFKIKIKTVSGAEEGFNLLRESEKGYILGSGLTLTGYRKENFRFSESYYKVKQKLVCNRYGKKASNRNEIKDIKLLVAKDTSYEENIERLSEVILDLKWSTDTINSEQALFKVYKKEVDCTIVDSSILALQQKIYPQLQDMFDISPAQPLHWFVSQDDYQMQRLINQWVTENYSNILQIQEKYFGYLGKDFDYYDNRVFKKRIISRLPQWKAFFKKASKRTGFDWRLIAALSYQESHWLKNARSPTGVRGLMMLTRSTAKRVGVTNRLDPEQSIMGGAKYLLDVNKRFSKEVEGEDLVWISLAAYNVGPSHIWDLIRHLKANNREINWRNIKELLPKLTEESFFKDLKYGYANGNEPLVYVDRIRSFYQDLKLQFD